MCDLISVIVPIYNVENYLSVCIDSLINQTHENLEIILVNDGSPDRCGEICDEYALKDDRIKVIHKQNGGLSDARNAGLKVAKGEYICFVDSDDWVEPDMFEILLDILKKSNTDFSVCGLINEYKNETTIKRNSDIQYSVFGKEETFINLIDNPLFYGYACNKLFKKDFLTDLSFDVNLLSCEDIDFSVKYAAKCTSSAFTAENLYHYRQHSASMTGDFSYNVRKLSVLDAYEKIIPYYRKFCPSYLGVIYKNYLKIAINIKGRMILSKVEDHNVSIRLENIIKQYYPLVLKDKNINFSTKINIILSRRFPATLLSLKQTLLKLKHKGK